MHDSVVYSGRENVHAPRPRRTLSSHTFVGIRGESHHRRDRMGSEFGNRVIDKTDASLPNHTIANCVVRIQGIVLTSDKPNGKKHELHLLKDGARVVEP